MGDATPRIGSTGKAQRPGYTSCTRGVRATPVLDLSLAGGDRPWRAGASCATYGHLLCHHHHPLASRPSERAPRERRPRPCLPVRAVERCLLFWLGSWPLRGDTRLQQLWLASCRRVHGCRLSLCHSHTIRPQHLLALIRKASLRPAIAPASPAACAPSAQRWSHGICVGL